MLSWSQAAPAARREKRGKEEAAVGLAGRGTARGRLAAAGGLENCSSRAGSVFPALQPARLCGRGEAGGEAAGTVPAAVLCPWHAVSQPG